MKKIINNPFNVKWVSKDSKKPFNFLECNREIIPGQVTKLAESINKMGIIRPIVVANIDFIDGQKKLYVVDGQHLFYALLRNGLDFPYIEIKIESYEELIEKMALLNSSSKSWTMLDYVHTWGCIKEDYKKLKKFFNTYDFDLVSLASVLYGNGPIEGGYFSTKIKKGKFKIENEKESVVLLNYLTDVLKIIPRLDRTTNRYTCSEFIKFVKSNSDYNHSRFITNLTKNKDKFVMATHEEGTLKEMFQKLSK